jgi:hypothetical protein
MARGTRAPSQNAYQGSLGRTRTEVVHVTGPKGELVAATVYTTIDALGDPELADRLRADTLNVTKLDGGDLRVAVPVLYHDPAAEVMALVLGDAHRHRELDERIRVYERLRADPAAIPVYVKELAVVYGGAGLRAYLESRAERAVGETGLERQRKELDVRTKELDSARRELDAKNRELELKTRELDAKNRELEARGKDLERQHKELERLRSEARARVIAAVQMPSEATTIGPPPTEERDDATRPVDRQDLDGPDDLSTDLVSALPQRKRAHSDFESEGATRHDPPAAHAVGSNGAGAHPVIDPSKVEYDDEDTTGESIVSAEPGLAIVPPGADPLTTETTEVPVASDAWLEEAARGSAASFRVEDGHVRLALVAGEQIARGLGGVLDVRVLLHRVNTYPVVVVLIGPPAALRVPSPTQLAVVALDIAREGDRQVLSTLAKKLELVVDVIVRGRPIRRVRLTAPLAENVAYVLRAADDHLRGITSDGETSPSFESARDLVLGAGYDLLGIEHAEHSEFRDEKLAQLDTAQAVRRAIAMLRRFARPSREDYLVCARGFPLVRWRELRRHVLESAVAWGLWMGPELAQIAVSEGLARSRRDLVLKLEAGFEALRRHPTAFDIDADAADDNQKAIAEEARAHGVEMRKRPQNGAIKSEDVSTVSGSIERTPTSAVPRQRSVEELLALLDDRKHRVLAAAELCDRGDARAAAPVIAAVKKMSRAEAVRILGKSVKFGAVAAGPLLEGLKSSKAFLRHGCALALALLRTDDGTYAVIELLLDEPTEIWREIARAVGQIGPPALMPLASRIGRMSDRLTPQLAERVAWAMAHVGVRGGKPALDQMASGQSIVAPIAKQALRLLDTAARDEVRLVPGQATRDVTVNRAFSRRFFEALEADRPDVAHAALHEIDASGPLELADEDLVALEEEEVEAELDESDLIQT